MHGGSFYVSSTNGSQIDPLSCPYSASQLPRSSSELFPDHLAGSSFPQKQARTFLKYVKVIRFCSKEANEGMVYFSS